MADVAAGSDAHQLVQSARIDRGQSGWCDEGVRDVLVGDQTRQFGSADDARWGDDHRGPPGTNSHQEFENRASKLGELKCSVREVDSTRKRLRSCSASAESPR